MVGLEQNILPHQRSISEGTVDEERRLLYVGITRAQEQMTLSYCAFRKKYKDKVSCDPSMFIKELDKKFLTLIDYEDVMGAESSDEEVDDFFANMRDLLSD